MAIQQKLADMSTEIDAARLLTYRAAVLKERGEPHTEAGAKARLYASEMARRQTAEAIQKRGGEAGMLFRDELEDVLGRFNPWLSAEAIRQLIEKLGPDHTGMFFHYDGTAYPW